MIIQTGYIVVSMIRESHSNFALESLALHNTERNQVLDYLSFISFTDPTIFNIHNKNGWTLLDIARVNGHTCAVRLIVINEFLRTEVASNPKNDIGETTETFLLSACD